MHICRSRGTGRHCGPLSRCSGWAYKASSSEASLAGTQEKRTPRTLEQHARKLNACRRLYEWVGTQVRSCFEAAAFFKGARAIAQGKCDPKSLAQLAKASLNKKVELAASLDGFYSEHFRWVLSEAIQ